MPVKCTCSVFSQLLHHIQHVNGSRAVTGIICTALCTLTVTGIVTTLLLRQYQIFCCGPPPPPQLWGTREGTAAQLGQEFGRAGTPAMRHLAHGCSCGCLASTSLPREPAPKLVQRKLAGAKFELQTLLRQGDTVQWTPRTRPLCQLWEVSQRSAPVDAQRGLADSCPSSLGTTKHGIWSATQ